MTLGPRIKKLEDYRSKRAQVGGMLFDYADDDGQRRCEVMLSGGEIIPYDLFRLRYPDGVGDFKLMNVNPHLL